MVAAALSGARWCILARVGQGAFGQVYRARMTRAHGIERMVAIKVHRESDRLNEQALARLRDEARFAARLQHRALVTVHELVQLPFGWSVVMDWVEGCDLRVLLDEGALPPSVACAIAMEVASALHYAWTAPVGDDGRPLRLVHRDLKPENIRLTPHGEVKVVDLGAAHGVLEEREAESTSMVIGTMAYIAPERLAGTSRDSPAIDVFALGLVLLDMLRGRRREGAAVQEHVLRGLREEVAREVRGDAGRALVELMRRMTSSNPEHRPSMHEVALALDELLPGLEGPSLRAWAVGAVVSDSGRGVEDVWCGTDVLEGPSEVTVSAESAPDPAPVVSEAWEADDDLVPPTDVARRRWIPGLLLFSGVIAMGLGILRASVSGEVPPEPVGGALPAPPVVPVDLPAEAPVVKSGPAEVKLEGLKPTERIAAPVRPPPVEPPPVQPPPKPPAPRTGSVDLQPWAFSKAGPTRVRLACGGCDLRAVKPGRYDVVGDIDGARDQRLCEVSVEAGREVTVSWQASGDCVVRPR
jgi:tRNA A-37 threonylcarbamoyl transferase component Bud32